MIGHKEMQAVATGRAKTYALLSALYLAPPSEAVAAVIRAGGLVQEGTSSLSGAANDLTTFFREATWEDRLDSELAAEHTRLFVLPSGVVPHESFYLDENKRMGGRVTMAVKRYYEDAAARLTSACIELPDHMGVEMDFMKFLCDIEAQFWQESNWAGVQKSLDFQNGFLTEHLLHWHGPLCGKVLHETTLDMYRALARLTIEFLEAEREFVPGLTEEIHSEWRKICVPES